MKLTGILTVLLKSVVKKVQKPVKAKFTGFGVPPVAFESTALRLTAEYSIPRGGRIPELVISVFCYIK